MAMGVGYRYRESPGVNQRHAVYAQPDIGAEYGAVAYRRHQARRLSSAEDHAE